MPLILEDGNTVSDKQGHTYTDGYVLPIAVLFETGKKNISLTMGVWQSEAGRDAGFPHIDYYHHTITDSNVFDAVWALVEDKLDDEVLTVAELVDDGLGNITQRNVWRDWKKKGNGNGGGNGGGNGNGNGGGNGGGNGKGNGGG